MILADTSVWINHLRDTDDSLVALLEHNTVLIHPMIIGELACGTMKNRQSLLALWHNLPAIVMITHNEAIYFLEQNRLMGRGIGFVDVHLLAAVALQGDARLWTHDKQLAQAADDLGLGFAEI